VKKLFTIALSLTLFIQAIPVLHFFVGKEKAATVYTFLDEDKPDGAKSKLKKDSQEYISLTSLCLEDAVTNSFHVTNHTSALPSPYLDSLTPPPDLIG